MVKPDFILLAAESLFFPLADELVEVNFLRMQSACAS
jgi:hypothetical protein